MQETESKIRIMAAKEKGHLCGFKYLIVEGADIGQEHNVKAPGLMRQDLLNAFAELNVHLAAIDDAFSGKEIDDISLVGSDEVSMKYTVSSFALHGEEDDLKIVLEGTKYIACGKGGRMVLKTPRIPLDESSSYKFASQLRESIEVLRTEIELYKDGKFDPVDAPEELEDENQLELHNEGKNEAIIQKGKKGNGKKKKSEDSEEEIKDAF